MGQNRIGFEALLKLNIKRRAQDGFAVGYNVVFPLIMIILLGALMKKGFTGEITSFQYYTVALLPFCIALAMITAAYAGKDDAYAKTAQRVLISPVSVQSIVLSKVISCTIVISICSIFVLCLAGLVWKLPVLEQSILFVLFFISYSFFISSIGTLIGLGMKNFLVVKNVMNLPIAVFAIAAGSFYPIGTLNERLQFLLNLSPLTWVNRGIFLALYDKQEYLLWLVTIVTLIAGIVITKVTILTFKKEEYIHGDLPSYEK